MPKIVKWYFASIKEYLEELNILSERNFQRYADLPAFIMDKLNKGITLTYFSDFMLIVFDYYEEEAKSIPPFCNSVPHLLQLHLFDIFDENY